MSTKVVSSKLEKLFAKGEQLDAIKGTLLTEQYGKANYFYFLLGGELSFYINVEEMAQELLVGESTRPFTPIGWSGFNEPNRYSSTVKVTSEKAQLIRWKSDDLFEHLGDSPEEYIFFLRHITSEGRRLIEETCSFLNSEEQVTITDSLADPMVASVLPFVEDEAQTTLRKSPFFEVFDEDFIDNILTKIEKLAYYPGQTVFHQGERKEGLFLLQEGEIDFFYTNEDRSRALVRTIQNPGYILGWSGFLTKSNLISAVVKVPSQVYFIPKAPLIEHFESDSGLAVKFYMRILWLITNQLQTLRARLVMKEYDQEWLSIQSLIEQNAARLRLNSDLNKVPYLLKSPLTLDDAFRILKQTQSRGDTMERHLANICMDILYETRKEQRFFKGLINVYQKVIQQPFTKPSAQIRKLCAKEVVKTFNNSSFLIKGWENLPERGGKIFVYNHLKNHPYNTLPNRFQITLDSHFISSMILFEKYGDPGLRIVRIGRSSEYGHQEYYDRLGHINVYTPESDFKGDIAEAKRKCRLDFYRRASQELQAGMNLIISPEGMSFLTEDSPGLFKPGAFNLALNMDPEPEIVPIAVANFDKRVRHNTFKCIIHKPFKVSNFVNDPNSKDEMSKFLVSYQNAFRQHVIDARNLREEHVRGWSVSA